MKEPQMRLVSRHLAETQAERRRRRLRTVWSLRALREAALTIGAILGVLCILSTAAAVALDIKPVVFESGSMSPAIDTGALAISRKVPAAQLKVGDVVTVRTGTGVRVTHRIQDMSLTGNGKASLVLKGDANGAADDKVYVVESAPRVLFSVPRAGYVVSFISGPAGIFAGGLLVGAVLLMVIRPGAAGAPPKAGGSRKAFSAVAVMVVGTCVTGVFSGTQTQALYTDTASMASGVFTRKAAPPAPPTPPTIVTCAPGTGNSQTFLTWTYPSGLGDPDSFLVKFAGTGAPPAVSFSGQVRGPVDLAAAVNNKTGTLWIVSIVNGVESAPSNVFTYQGNGGNRTCVPN